MPFLITENVEWHEIENKVYITVPVSSRVDVKPSIFTSSKYLKISSPPYLWECFLFSTIDSSQSYIRIEDNTISFELKKVTSELWHQLTDPQSDDKVYKRKQREISLEENEKYLKHEQDQKSRKQQDIHRTSVCKQMEVDNTERNRIAMEKTIENKRMAEEIEIEKRKQQLKANEMAQKKKQLQQLSKDMLPARKSGHITVHFTPRVFDTAARESQEAEENEWLQKQFSASVKLKLDCSDLSAEERNPEWLKTKAESLYKKGDFKSAINAYSLAIRMCPHLFSLYSGRAICHLNLRNLHKVIEDSSKALELLVPPVPSNASARAETHMVRGNAFKQLELYIEGLMDIEAALKIDPANTKFNEMAQELRDLVENVQ